MNLSSFFIHTAQLDVLGFHQTYRILTVILIIIFIIYLISKPIVKKLIDGRYITFITYIMLSLTVLTGSSLIAIYHNDLDIVILTIQSIIMFSFCLVLFILFSTIKQLIQRK